MIKKLEDYRKQQKDNYSNSIDLDINFIDDVSNYLNILEIRLFTCGLYESDISEIESAIQRLYAIDYDINMQIRNHISNTQIDERYHELIKYQKYLLTVIGDILLF